MKICFFCGKEFKFLKYHPYQIYCSSACRDKFNNKKKKSEIREANSKRIFVCEVCRINYKPVYFYQQTCGNRKCVLALYHKKKQQDLEFRVKRALWQRNRKHRLRANGGNFTIGEWDEMKLQHDFSCRFCRKKEPDIKLTQDHIFPISRGGLHEAINIQPLCSECNSRKGDMV